MLVKTRNTRTGRYTEVLARAVVQTAESTREQAATVSGSELSQRPKNNRESYKKALLGINR